MAAATLSTRLTPEQRLALSYAPSVSHAYFAGLFAFDRALGHAVAHGREPLAAQLRLAWWRDELAAGAPTAIDRRIGALVRRWPDERAPLLAMVDGWEELTAASPDWSACVRGRAAPFEALAAELACSPASISAVGSAAKLWLLLDLGEHLSDTAEQTAVRGLARAIVPSFARLPRSMRPLSVLAGLAQRALACDGPLLGDRFSPLYAMRLGIFGR